MSTSNHETVGSMFQQAKMKAIRGLVIFFGILVYIGMVVYAEVHNFTLMTKGVPDDLIIWAILGIVSIGITAIMLPLGIHYWTHDTLHRIIAFLFYFVDLGIMILNVIIDYTLQSGGVLPEWGNIYFNYVIPTTPIIVGMMWSILFMMDPTHREIHQIEEMKSTARNTLFNRIAKAAEGADIDDIVTATAQEMANDIVSGTLGKGKGKINPTHVLPPATLNGHASPPSQNGQTPRRYNLTAPIHTPNGKKYGKLPRFISDRIVTTVQCPQCQSNQPVKELPSGELECLTCHTVLSLTPMTAGSVNPTNGGQTKS